MKKLIGVVLLLMILLTPGVNLEAKKLADLSDLYAPFFIALDEENVYISQKAEIFVYSRTDYTFKFKFGKTGNGPQEMQPIANLGLTIYPQKNKTLVVNSMGKILFFTREGKFIKEIANKSQAGQTMPFFRPMEGKDDKFIGPGMAIDEKNQTFYFTYNILDGDLKVIKEFGRKPFMTGNNFKFPTETLLLYVAGDKIVAPGSGDGFTLDVYDNDGKRLNTISRDEKQLKITETYKQGLLAFLKKQMAGNFEALKKRIKFKEFFPSYQAFWVDNEKIYILTYAREKGKAEFFVYTLDGKFRKRVMLPFAYISDFMAAPWAIKDNILYQAVENEEEELIELFGYKIE